MVDIAPKNGINALVNDKGTHAIVSLFVGDKPMGWVEFDADQLANLIVMLSGVRAQLVGMALARQKIEHKPKRRKPVDYSKK